MLTVFCLSKHLIFIPHAVVHRCRSWGVRFGKSCPTEVCEPTGCGLSLHCIFELRGVASINRSINKLEDIDASKKFREHEGNGNIHDA